VGTLNIPHFFLETCPSKHDLVEIADIQPYGWLRH
jgi:hypothetical protein